MPKIEIVEDEIGEELKMFIESYANKKEEENVDVDDDLKSVDSFKLRLRELREKRLKDYKAGKQINYWEYSAPEIYSDALKEISKMLKRIKTNFGDRVSKCSLFNKVGDRSWAQSFRDNFHKISIDRKDHYKNMDRYFYNEISMTNSLKTDIYYAESFAISFLLMLHMVHERFEQNKNEIGAEDFLLLLKEFNDVVAIGDDKESKSPIVSPVFARYTDVEEVFRSQKDEFNRYQLFYDFSWCKAMFAFPENYGHKEKVRGYYEEYCKNSNPSSLDISRLVVSVSSFAHIYIDGNGRSALMAGWFLSILNNLPFSIPKYPYLMDKDSVKEGLSWAEEFFENPQKEIEKIDFQEYLIKDLGFLDGADLTTRIILRFLSDKKDDELFFEVPRKEDAFTDRLQQYTTGEGRRVITHNKVFGCEATFDLRFLRKAVDKGAGEVDLIVKDFLEDVIENFQLYKKDDIETLKVVLNYYTNHKDATLDELIEKCESYITPNGLVPKGSSQLQEGRKGQIVTEV